MMVEEIRLAIKLLIHAFKNEGDLAFQEYTKVCQSVITMQGNEPGRLLNSLVIQQLKELLDTLTPKLKPNDEAILSILRQALG
jgi:hypothetical protein